MKKFIIEMAREVLEMLAISILYLAFAGTLLVSLLGRSAFPEGNVIDILSVCLGF